MGVMCEIIDSRSFSDFCGVSTPDQVPNGDTIGNFRNLLIRNNIQEQIFAHVVSILSKNHLILKKGTIVDLTLISAPTSTKNADRKRDLEAHSVEKGTHGILGTKLTSLQTVKPDLYIMSKLRQRMSMTSMRSMILFAVMKMTFMWTAHT